MAKTYKSNSEPKVDKRQELVDKIIAKMEEAVEYEKPWFSSNEFPYNPVTGTHYKGINVLSLMAADYNDPRFYTFNNIKDLAKELELPIHVKKGSEAIPVFKAVQVPVGGSDSKTEDPDSASSESTKMIWRYTVASYVFNASQIENLPSLTTERTTVHEPIQAAEQVVEAMKSTGLSVSHGNDGRAFYRPSTDSISLPHPEQFKSSELYYRTLLHEVAHATGGESRLNRDQKNTFGSKAYAKEELVAELTSYFMGNEIGLPYDAKTHENHAAYLKSWIECLKEDKSFLFQAASAANKATDYQMTLTQEYILNQENPAHKEIGETKMNEATEKFFNAFQRFDVKQMKSSIEEGLDVNARDTNGFTAFFRAIQLEKMECCRLLLDAGSDPNVQLSDGDTPLHMAAIFENIKMTTMLLEAGADVNAQDEKGRTPLHYVSQCTDPLPKWSDIPELAKMLIDAGADFMIQDEEGNTPAMLTNDDRLKTLFSELEAKLLLEGLEDSPEPIESTRNEVRM